MTNIQIIVGAENSEYDIPANWIVASKKSGSAVLRNVTRPARRDAGAITQSLQAVLREAQS